MPPRLLPVLLPLALALALSPARADQFVTGQAAANVLGQANFTSASPGSAPNRFTSPFGVAYDPATGKVFVADTGNHRILRFSSVQAAWNGGDPEAVLGQINFTSKLMNQGGAAGANTLRTPQHIMLDHRGRLWVADYGNHRVLGYFAASYASTNAAADHVFGQSDFTNATAATAGNRMSNPYGVHVDRNDNLWVADSFNYRVLLFKEVSKKDNGTAADYVIGKTNFTDGAAPGAPSATNLGLPVAVAVDALGNLWIAEAIRSRVVRYNNAGAISSNGLAASGVLGHTLFTTSGAGLSATALNAPYGVLAAADGTLWVADASNRRALGFRNAAAKANGAAADLALGQANLATSAVVVSAASLTSAYGISSGPDGSLLVADQNANRVMRFLPVKSPTVTIATRPGKTSSSKRKVRGRATGQVTRVTYRIGKSGPFRTAKGTVNWSFTAKLKKGRNPVTVVADGPGGTSAPRKITLTRI